MAVGIEGKRFNAWTWLSMPVLCGGLGLCSAEEVNFHWLGAIFCTGATVLRGLKSIMQGAIMSKKEDRLDAVTLLYYMAPWAAAVLSVLGLFSEGLEPWTLLISGLQVDQQVRGNVKSCMSIAISVMIFGNELKAAQAL